jgi:hypothetical protein
MKPDTNVSPWVSTFETVASPGKRPPSRRWNSASKRSVANGDSFMISALRRSSWRSPNSGGMINERIVVPIASASVQPKSRSAAAFQPTITPARSSVMNASGAVSNTMRVRTSERSSCCARSLSSRSRREMRRPATSGVPMASSQRTTTLSGS